MLNHSEMTYANVLSDLWSSLREGAKHGVHPFHTPVLATVFGQDPDIRTVVLRHADEKQSSMLPGTRSTGYGFGRAWWATFRSKRWVRQLCCYLVRGIRN